MLNNILMYALCVVAGFMANACYKKLRLTKNRKRVLRYCLACGGGIVPYILGILWQKHKTHKKAMQLIWDNFPSINERRYPAVVKTIYEEAMGKKLDLKHPHSFNEKLQCSKSMTPPP